MRPRWRWSKAPASAKPSISRAAKLITLVLVLVIPIATLQLYQKIGTPNAIGFSGPGAGTVQTSAGPAMDANSAPDLNKAADTLAAKLKDTPDDGAGWALLARTYRATERFVEANDAYTRARALLPEEPDLLAESAEAMGLSSTPRSLSGEPEKLIARALELDPNNQNALFLKGLARAQADDPAGAEATWERLLSLMEAGSPSQIAVVEQLNIVRERLGKAPMETPAAGPVAPAAPMAAPAAAPMAAGNKTPDLNAAGIDVSVSVAPELADLVQPGDTLFVFARAEAGPPAPLAIQRRSRQRTAADAAAGRIDGHDRRHVDGAVSARHHRRADFPLRQCHAANWRSRRSDRRDELARGGQGRHRDWQRALRKKRVLHAQCPA